MNKIILNKAFYLQVFIRDLSLKYNNVRQHHIIHKFPIFDGEC